MGGFADLPRGKNTLWPGKDNNESGKTMKFDLVLAQRRDYFGLYSTGTVCQIEVATNSDEQGRLTWLASILDPEFLCMVYIIINTVD